MYIALDGSDQLNNGVPQFRSKTSKDTARQGLKHHVEIAQVAGSPEQVYTFVTQEDIRGDPNLTVECIQRILKKEERRRGGALPKELCLQLDNCWRENKNSYTLAYLASLVERGIFDVIYLSFLPVGHTNFVPDRIASRIAVAVKKPSPSLRPRRGHFNQRRLLDNIYTLTSL